MIQYVGTMNIRIYYPTSVMPMHTNGHTQEN